jgi:hypothetical protein
MRERQGHQSRCHGLSTFLAEIVVFDIGKVEISQYYLTHHERIATAFGFPLFLAELVVSGIGKVEKLQYYLIPGRKSRNITVLPHPFANGKVEILQL